jgi:hypothetical protein
VPPPPAKGAWYIESRLGRALSGAVRGPFLGGSKVQLTDTLPRREGEGLQEKTPSPKKARSKKSRILPLSH